MKLHLKNCILNLNIQELLQHQKYHSHVTRSKDTRICYFHSKFYTFLPLISRTIDVIYRNEMYLLP